MKIEFLWDVKTNELELHFIVSAIVGAMMFLVGAFWDGIIGVKVPHHEGWGIWQILWCAGWGMLTLWSYFMATKWGEKK